MEVFLWVQKPATFLVQSDLSQNVFQNDFFELHSWGDFNVMTDVFRSLKRRTVQDVSARSSMVSSLGKTLRHWRDAGSLMGAPCQTCNKSIPAHDWISSGCQRCVHLFHVRDVCHLPKQQAAVRSTRPEVRWLSIPGSHRAL
ncbi:hypothetical protein RLO149_c009560 [Roseobacter litoralis Och 149]|uniref:Uncharacterized protein n=1 Tax=Roseobacter litoralis (strain ATCC 49566 / DSM 6996 / JCM 21268 / NBRC 15278 / OCh 149) TaxID=391595 RepID=F7ZAH0_ROSLO|nr:hypothetical protein RLO149_c009560 [Roseobacter litoralis Och 149]